MPWFRSEHMMPPTEEEITTFKNGTRETRKYEAVDIYHAGKLSKEFPPWWARTTNLPDPPEAKDKGIDDHFSFVHEDVCRPKIVKGRKP